jgi:four helix bundle protein
MRRAASSISSNLSEGSGRSSTKDQAHFYQISYSSNLELLNHFYTALDLSYIDEKTFEKLRNLVCALSFKINALRKSRISSTPSTCIPFNRFNCFNCLNLYSLQPLKLLQLLKPLKPVFPSTASTASTP